ncbi:MAG: thioesterase family protein [bacterium]|nr:thioesterase family protein [bacterium]
MSFDDDIAVRREGSDVYACDISPNYMVIAGPNGGYLAALLVRAADVHLDDPTRQLRSLTIHYLRPPKDGPATIEVTIEQSGRTVAYLRLRMEQAGKTVLLATGAWALARAGLEFDGWSPPEAPPPEDCAALQSIGGGPGLPVHAQWDIRAVSEATFGSGGVPDLVWWIRPKADHPLDAPLVVAISDALPPPIFVTEVGRTPVPTLDLTVHVRCDLAEVDWKPGDWVLTRFTTRRANAGFLEEDGELWTADGRLLAHSRQLALSL